MTDGTLRVWLELRVDGEPLSRYGDGELADAVAGADVVAERSPQRVVEVVRCRLDGTEVTVLHYDAVHPPSG
jgi:hypothetical protein